MTILCGDCLEVMATYPPDTFDSIVTDPPYEYGFMGKTWDRNGVAFRVETWAEVLRVAKPGAHLLAFGGTRTWHRLACALEDAGWEIRDTIAWIYGQGFPKSHDVAWQMHLDACAICGSMVEYDHDNEQATGSLPEAEHGLRFVRAAYLSTPVYACAECGQVLQPFMSKQEAQAIRAAWAKSEVVWPEQPSLEGRGNLEAPEGQLQGCPVCQMSHGVLADGAEGWLHHGASARDGSIPWQVPNSDGSRPSYRPQSREQLHRQPDTFPLERQAQKSRGFGTALKPAFEPIIVARRPVNCTVAENVLKWGTGGMNIDGCRVEGVMDGSWGGVQNTPVGYGHTTVTGYQTVQHPAGRWPANLIHDGSDEVMRGFPQAKAGVAVRHNSGGNTFGGTMPKPPMADMSYADSGSAARFFYCAKASKQDRDEGCEWLPYHTAGECTDRQEGTAGLESPRAGAGRTNGSRNHHPTVKPTALMRYLVRLVTPPGGIVLDPFCGSGSTGKAAVLEGFDFIGIDKDAEYCEIARARAAHAQRQPRLHR